MKVKVAVIDSGIELYHEAFKNSHVSGTRIIKRGCCLEKNEDIYDTRKADEIVVLNQGKIVEIGNHESLMQKKQYYYQLVEERSV